MTTTIINSLRNLYNPFSFCNLDAYLHSIRRVHKSLHEMMPENGIDHDAFLIIMSELDTIYECAKGKSDSILIYWGKLKAMIPFFEIILEGNCTWEYAYEAYAEIEKILYS